MISLKTAAMETNALPCFFPKTNTLLKVTPHNIKKEEEERESKVGTFIVSLAAVFSITTQHKQTWIILSVEIVHFQQVL